MYIKPKITLARSENLYMVISIETTNRWGPHHDHRNHRQPLLSVVFEISYFNQPGLDHRLVIGIHTLTLFTAEPALANAKKVVAKTIQTPLGVHRLARQKHDQGPASWSASCRQARSPRGGSMMLPLLAGAVTAGLLTLIIACIASSITGPQQ